MLLHVDMIYLAKQAKRGVEKSNQIEPRTGFLQFYVKTKKVCKRFASFSSEQAHFTHGMYKTALIHPSHVKNRTDHVLKGIMPKFSGAVGPSP